MTSIIIPVYKMLHYTRRAVEAIRANTSGDYEIVLSEDGSEEHGEYAKRARLSYVTGEHGGFAVACNRGAEVARGDVLVFLNNDTVVQKGWLEALLAPLGNGYHVTAPLLLYPGGILQHCGMVVGWALGQIKPRLLYEGYPWSFPPAHKRREFSVLTGACLAIQRDVWEDVGGFDEAYINGLEDVDMCLRLRQKGYRLLYCPEAKVIHYCGMSPGRFDHEKKNYELFLSRWQGKVRLDEWKYYIEDLPHSLRWIVKVAVGSFCPQFVRRLYWQAKRYSIRRMKRLW